jgi:hypothetical protein
MDGVQAFAIIALSIFWFYVGGSVAYDIKDGALNRCAAQKMTIQQCAEINGWKLGE